MESEPLMMGAFCKTENESGVGIFVVITGECTNVQCRILASGQCPRTGRQCFDSQDLWIFTRSAYVPIRGRNQSIG